MSEHFILKIHSVATIYMLGIIVLIQFIHYPLFAIVGKENFIEYHSRHVQLTSFVIAPPMILELISLALLYYLSPDMRSNLSFHVSTIALIVIWLTTFFISVPQHNILSQGFNQDAWRVLVSTNWIRTIAWAIRAFVIFKML